MIPTRIALTSSSNQTSTARNLPKKGNKPITKQTETVANTVLVNQDPRNASKLAGRSNTRRISHLERNKGIQICTDLQEAASLFEKAVSEGIKITNITYDVLMNKYLEQNKPQEALALYQKCLDSRNTPDCRMIITTLRAHILADHFTKSLEFYDLLQQKNAPLSIILLNTLMRACIKHDYPSLVFHIIERALAANTPLNTSTLSIALEACSLANTYNEIPFTLYEKLKQAHLSPTHEAYEGLIDLCLMRNESGKSLPIYEEMKRKGHRITNASTFNTMICANLTVRKYTEAANIYFKDMLDAKVKANEMTYSLVIDALVSDENQIPRAIGIFKKYFEKQVTGNVVDVQNQLTVGAAFIQAAYHIRRVNSSSHVTIITGDVKKSEQTSLARDMFNFVWSMLEYNSAGQLKMEKINDASFSVTIPKEYSRF